VQSGITKVQKGNTRILTMTAHLQRSFSIFTAFKDLISFLRNVANDERIPARDKKLVLALIALILMPFDIIPDWIPVIGVLDDLILMALILDYFFNVLDQEILLSHFPWSMKTFARIRWGARLIALLTPNFIKDKIWKYKPSVFRN
jgi:uncharacterized membrane protein YkvA (DUF1232 family)